MTRRTPTRRGVLAGAAALAAVPGLPFAVADTPQTHEVEIRSFAFHPAVIRARVGDRIRWTNTDLAPHTATADDLGWDTGTLARNDAEDILVTEGMETTYFCVFHPHMKGRIDIVR